MEMLEITVWIVSGILAFMYVMAGMMKLWKTDKAQSLNATMAAQGTTKIRLIGGAEVLGAVGIILPAAMGSTAVLSGFAAVGLVAIQGFAIPAHIQHKDTRFLAVNFALLLMAAFVALFRFDLI